MFGRRRGLGLPGTLLVVFLTLKLTGLVAWSWVWVLAPAWIGAALLAIGIGVFRLRRGRGACAARGFGRWQRREGDGAPA
jgi:hypothetical protein